MAPTRATVEPAVRDDLTTIADLWVRLADEQRDHDSHVLADENRETMHGLLAGYLVDDGLLVARLDGAIVGFASFTVERGSLALEASRGLLSNLYVVPEHRGRGIGTELLRAVEDELAARDVDVLLLEVLANNEAARRFYRRSGYDPHRIGMARSIGGDEAESNDGDDEAEPNDDGGTDVSDRIPSDRERNDTHTKEDG